MSYSLDQLCHYIHLCYFKKYGLNKKKIVAIWNPAWNSLKSMKIFPLAPVWAGPDSRGPMNKNIHDNIIKTSSLKRTKLRSHRWPKLLYFLMGLKTWFCSLTIFYIAVCLCSDTLHCNVNEQMSCFWVFSLFLFFFSTGNSLFCKSQYRVTFWAIKAL